jgi:hypothetical protein
VGDDWPEREPPGANMTAAGDPCALEPVSSRPSSWWEAAESCADAGRGVVFVLSDVDDDEGPGVLFF